MIAGLLLAMTMLLSVTAAAGAASRVPLRLHPLLGKYDVLVPTDLASDAAKPNRLYLTALAGKIHVLEGGRLTLFADLSARVLNRTGAGEQGLYSVALAPDFATSRHLYIGYSNNDADLEVDELTTTADGLRMKTRRTVLTVRHPNRLHHFLGRVVFGPDGYLYVSTGDGFTADTGPTRVSGEVALRLGDLRGKLLRIDPADPPGAARYTAPADNPFAADGDPATAPEIWSSGFRNPYRFSFDRLTGDLLLADVGESRFEEINWIPSPAAGAAGAKGLFFGWPCREGLLASQWVTQPYCAGAPPHTDPIFTYAHTEGPGDSGTRAIIGGFVVRDPNLGDLYGRYLYGDYMRGTIRSLRVDRPATTDRAERALGTRPAYDLGSFGEDALGRIYLLSARYGRLFRVEPSNAFTIAAVTSDAARGSVQLGVKVPTAGTVTVSGKGLKPAVVATEQGGKASVAVVPVGETQRGLQRDGAATVTVTVTFAPKGGTARTVSRPVKLKLER